MGARALNSKAIDLALALAGLVALGATVPRFVDDAPSAQEAHVKRVCGWLAPGEGLTKLPDGREQGWVASMIRGVHQFRIRGPGTVEVSAAKLREVDFEGALMHTITLTGTTKESVLEWKIPGARDWESVDKAFLYDDVARKLPHRMQEMVDFSIASNIPMPGMTSTPEEMKDPRRLVPPEQWPATLAVQYGTPDPSVARRAQIDAERAAQAMRND